MIILLFLSCTKHDVIDRYALLEMARKVNPDVAPLMAKDLKSGVKCKTESGELIYGQGCIGAFQVKVDLLDMIVLEFETPEMAKREAIRLGQFYFKNWVFDDVAGEPFLEKFVIKAFAAQKGLAPASPSSGETKVSN